MQHLRVANWFSSFDGIDIVTMVSEPTRVRIVVDSTRERSLGTRVGKLCEKLGNRSIRDRIGKCWDMLVRNIDLDTANIEKVNRCVQYDILRSMRRTRYSAREIVARENWDPVHPSNWHIVSAWGRAPIGSGLAPATTRLGTTPTCAPHPPRSRT